MPETPARLGPASGPYAEGNFRKCSRASCESKPSGMASRTSVVVASVSSSDHRNVSNNRASPVLGLTA